MNLFFRILIIVFLTIIFSVGVTYILYVMPKDIEIVVLKKSLQIKRLNLENRKLRK